MLLQSHSLRARQNGSQHVIVWLALAALVAAGVMAAPSSALAADLYVSHTAVGAYASVAAAVTAAASGDTIHVDVGTYNCNVVLNKQLTLVGAGPELTTLNGEADGTVIQVNTGGTGSMISQLKITAGKATNGGGVYCNSSSPIISYCVVTENEADAGGGIYFSGSSSARVTGSTISSNTAADAGGGIYGDTESSVAVEDCVIQGNRAAQAGGSGGGVYSVEGTMTVRRTTISGSEADIYGGGYLSAGGWSSIEECTIADNSAGHGGGVAVLGGEALITSSTITANAASTQGGGLAIFGGTVATMTASSICSNTVTPNMYAMYGGGAYLMQSTAVFDRCVVNGNSAPRGGGVGEQQDSSSTFTNCLFAENAASDEGGALFCDAGSATSWVNCTVADNQAADYGGLYHQGGYGLPPGRFTNSIAWGNGVDINDFEAVYSDFEAATPGGTNISADPMFVNAAAGDYRLTAESPCADTGTSTGAPATDIDGVSRPQGAGYDMGAYERAGATYTLSYRAGVGGSIEGSATQVVRYGGSGTSVTAVPSAGYVFTGWSDGATVTSRTDAHITADKTVTAQFVSAAGYVKLGTVRFGIRSSKLTRGTKRALRAQARSMVAQGVTKVRVDGYTSKIPDGGTTWRANKRLSEARARTVRKYLAAQLKTLGSHASVTSAGYGSSDPVKSNRTKSGRAANRRAEVWVK